MGGGDEASAGDRGKDGSGGAGWWMDHLSGQGFEIGQVDRVRAMDPSRGGELGKRLGEDDSLLRRWSEFSMTKKAIAHGEARNPLACVSSPAALACRQRHRRQFVLVAGRSVARACGLGPCGCGWRAREHGHGVR